MVVKQEGATPKVAGSHRDRCIRVVCDPVDAGACSPLEYVSVGTRCRSTTSLRLKALGNVR